MYVTSGSTYFSVEAGREGQCAREGGYGAGYEGLRCHGTLSQTHAGGLHLDPSEGFSCELTLYISELKQLEKANIQEREEMEKVMREEVRNCEASYEVNVH